MTNEEFQRIVLEELKSLREGQEDIKKEQVELKKGLEGVIEQTADLTEFRQEVKEELSEIKSTISRIEIATADNWSDIARIKSLI